MPGTTRPPAPAAHVTVDTVAPALTGLSPDAGTVQWFSPNGDGVRETVGFSAANSETGSLVARVRNGGGTVVRTFSVGNDDDAATVAWDGRSNANAVVPDGDYVMSVAPVDAAGNAGAAQERTVQVVTGPPLGRRARAPSSTRRTATGTLRRPRLRFTLTRPMTVTWTVRDAAGNTVLDTHLTPYLRPAGTYYWTFDGRRPDGSMLPQGRYLSYVSRHGRVADRRRSSRRVRRRRLRDQAERHDAGAAARPSPSNSRPRSRSKNPRLCVYEPGWRPGASPTDQDGHVHLPRHDQAPVGQRQRYRWRFKVSARTPRAASAATTTTGLPAPLSATPASHSPVTAPDRPHPHRTIPDRDHRAVDRGVRGSSLGTSMDLRRGSSCR